MVIKHSWRGRYKRILCISNESIITLDPSTLSVTNSYDVGSDFDGASPIIGRDENSNEFNINVRTEGRGKFKAFKFSSKYRASILTELHRIRWNMLAAVAEYPVLRLRRRTSDWVSFKMKITYAGIEVIDLKSGELSWCLDFRDMNSPAVVFLSDGFGKKNVDHGGFVLCALYGRNSKAFQAASGSLNAVIISNLLMRLWGRKNLPLAVGLLQDCALLLMERYTFLYLIWNLGQKVELVISVMQYHVNLFLPRFHLLKDAQKTTKLLLFVLYLLSVLLFDFLRSHKCSRLNLMMEPYSYCKTLRDIRELRWAMAIRIPVLTAIQAMLSFEPTIVEASAALLKSIVTRNHNAMIRLYVHDLFFH